MKILSYLNISNPQNLEADSGYVFQSLLLKRFLKEIHNVEIYLICTKDTPIIDPRINHIRILNSHCNKYSVRFDFPWFFYKKLDFLQDIDVAIINQSELTSNFRALFSVVGNNKVKIATYYHYFPIENLPSNNIIEYESPMNHSNLAQVLFSRQIDSMISSDICITCSKYAISFFKKNAMLVNPKSFLKNQNKLININPPISELDALESKTNDRFRLKTLVYNHRLYKHYGTETIFQWLSELYSKRNDFQVLVTDPTGKRTSERNKLNPDVVEFKKNIAKLPFVKIKHIKDRKNYYKILWKSHLGLGPLKPSALWSMSVVDLLACHKPVLAPNYSCFPEMLSNHKNLLFNDKVDFFKKLNLLLDNKEIYSKEQKFCHTLSIKYSDNFVAKKFIKTFHSPK